MNTNWKFYAGISVGLVISMLIGFVAGSINQYSDIQKELETHLKTNNNKIVLRNILDLRKDIDSWYSFTVDCYNTELGMPFEEYVRFNSETKELVGYNVLEYYKLKR